jgi:hypothetical protein
VRACNLIIEHIVEYQNSYAFIFLFQDNLLSLLLKGIAVADLLSSDIFSHMFDADDWPLIHKDNSFEIMPYNGSIFQLRGKYKTVFP